MVEQVHKPDRSRVVAFRTSKAIGRILDRVATRKKTTISILVEEEMVKPYVRKLDNGNGGAQ